MAGNWAAIEKGVNIALAVQKLNELDKEKETLERELALVGTRERLDADVQAVSKEILRDLERLEEVLEQGSVMEVKAILRAYIGRVEYDPENKRARVGFLRMRSRALVSHLAPETARIRMVAGAHYKAEKTIAGLEVGFAFDQVGVRGTT